MKILSILNGFLTHIKWNPTYAVETQDHMVQTTFWNHSALDPVQSMPTLDYLKAWDNI